MKIRWNSAQFRVHWHSSYCTWRLDAMFSSVFRTHNTMRKEHSLFSSLACALIPCFALIVSIHAADVPGPGSRLVGADEPAKLVEARKIWDQAPHNAFTDLVRFHDRWYCVFREGKAHVAPDGALRVITSTNGEKWESAALITSP